MKLQHANVPAAQRSTHSYDARNRLTFIDHPIGTSDISYSYFADGALHTAATATSTWSYSYDKRGLLRNETLATNGLSLPVNYSYTTLGHRASVQYPDGATVNLLPNALDNRRKAEFVGASRADLHITCGINAGSNRQHRHLAAHRPPGQPGAAHPRGGHADGRG